MGLELLHDAAGTNFTFNLTKISTDKAHADKKDEAHTKFQEIAFAYAVLSDPIRRKRYDTTGSTTESISQDEDFNWADFYASQFRDVVTSGAIEAFSKAYKGSDEEKDDVLKYYKTGKGNWDRIYESVMVSNPLEDEDRFRGYIDEAIEKGEVKGYKAYLKEPKEEKLRRHNASNDEGAEAVEYAKKLGIHDKLFGPGDKPIGKDGLAALIQKKQADRGTSFLDNLEAKYKQQEKKKTKKGKKVEEDEDMGMPDEAAFQAAAARLNKPKASASAGEANGRKAKRAKHS